MRRLTGGDSDAIAAERSRVATEGRGAQLLTAHTPNGIWRGGQWDLVTLYALVVLNDLGLDPASDQAGKVIGRVAKHLVFKPLGNRPYLHGENEPCINGRILRIGAYFGEPNDALANQLLDYAQAGRKSAGVTKARKRGEEYFLTRRLFCSLRTGKVIANRWQRFAYPPFWHYDVLRGSIICAMRASKLVVG